MWFEDLNPDFRFHFAGGLGSGSTVSPGAESSLSLGLSLNFMGIYGGLQKWRIPKLAGWCRMENPIVRNGWWLGVPLWLRKPLYPPVKQHGYGKWSIYRWRTYWKWWFSIAMLVYQRVTGIQWEDNGDILEDIYIYIYIYIMCIYIYYIIYNIYIYNIIYIYYIIYIIYNIYI